MDRPHLLNSEAPRLFDFNDPDSQYVMFNRELEGRFLLTFSELMAAEGGRVLLRGFRDGRGNMKLRFLPLIEGEYKILVERRPLLYNKPKNMGGMR